MTDIPNLISQTADGVFAIDPDHRIILWNRSAEEILGFSADEALGRFCYEVLPGRDPAGNLFCFKGCSVITMIKKDQLIRSYDVQMMTKAGRKVWLNVSIVLVPSPKQNGPVIVHLFRSAGRSVEYLAQQVASTVLAALGVSDRTPRAGRVSSSATTSPLTRRETEILMLLAQCLGIKEIADRLCISHATVRTHIQHILEKLQVHNRLEAVTVAFQQNLLQTNSCGHLSISSNQLPQSHD